MTKVLVVAPPPPQVPDLVSDLVAQGFAVEGRCEGSDMVREAIRLSPDVLVLWEPHTGPALFENAQVLCTAAPMATLVFTADVHAEWMDRALDAGIDGWEVNGYGVERLRPLIQLTLSRWRRNLRAREERNSLQQRYEERRLVERAKGLLMSTRRIDEDEAFRLLRSASMHAKLRLGQVSRRVIDSARFAEGINRAGRLRMLSQRIVKLYALLVAGVEQASSRALLAHSRQQGEAIFAALEKCLSRPTFGDLIDASAAVWSQLRSMLDGPVNLQTLGRMHELGEELLQQAERLTAAVASAGLGAGMQVINVSGRQRMLAQRVAKQALIRSLLPQSSGDAAPATQAFEQGLSYLVELPLSTAAIRDDLARARAAWEQMLQGVAQAGQPAGQVALAGASEELLEIFDRLTGTYEHSMQLLTG